MIPRFKNRRQAGRLLAELLTDYKRRSDVSVLALPRGGVPVAYEVAKALRARLDVFLVRKLGVPGHEELAMGAIAAGGTRLINWSTVRALGISDRALQTVMRNEEQELARREQLYRGDAPRQPLTGRVVILVDDGLATGSTMKVAIKAVREHYPSRLVVAVPVAASSTRTELAIEADEIVCAVTPEPFYAVGQWYEDFSQTTDEEVRALLQALRRDQQIRDIGGAPAQGL